MAERTTEDFTKDKINIKVMGIGGGGCNAVTQMIKSGIKGVDFYVVNTEKGSLDRMDKTKCHTIQIGRELTDGLGAGANPEIGEKACEENMSDIEKALDDTDLLFLTCGMGGGTGTGAIPLIARAAKSKGITTIGIVTLPFGFEGKLRVLKAEQGIERLEPHVNSLIVIDNNKLLKLEESNLKMINAFKKTDDILEQAIRAVTDLIYSVGTINVDFADITTIFKYEGYAYMGIGKAEGENKIEEATKAALNNSLTITTINNAKGVIFNVKGSSDISLDEINRSASLISEKVDPDANIIFGTNIDESLGEEVIITVVATSVDKKIEDNINR